SEGSSGPGHEVGRIKQPATRASPAEPGNLRRFPSLAIDLPGTGSKRDFKALMIGRDGQTALQSIRLFILLFRFFASALQSLGFVEVGKSLREVAFKEVGIAAIGIIQPEVRLEPDRLREIFDGLFMFSFLAMGISPGSPA